MRRTLPLLLVSCIAASSLSAPGAPLDRAGVSANPAWVVHVDTDALRQTYIGKYFLYHMDKPEMNSNMLAFQSIFSFDLRTQWHGLTVYGNSPAENDAIYIIFADLVPDHLIALLKAKDYSTTITNNHQVIYSWIDKGRLADGDPNPRKYAAFRPNRMIVGVRQETVAAALNVIDGRVTNFASSKTWPELGAAGGVDFVQGAARKTDFRGSDPAVALLKAATELKLHASETDEQLSAVLTAVAGSELAAKQMSIASRGLVALLGLQNDNPALARLADGISIKQQGVVVTLTLSIPSTELIAALKAYDAKKAK